MPISDDRNKLMTRRAFVQRSAGILFCAGMSYYAADAEPDDLEVTRTDVLLSRWRPEADGVTIGQLSDFHADYQHAVDRTARSVEMLMQQKPDIAFVTGDYVTAKKTRRYLKATIESLRPLTKAPRGAFAILGNHDCIGDCHAVTTRLLSEAGFEVLNNRSVPFPGVDGAYIVGLDDPWCGRMDVDAALKGLPRDAPKLVAVHEPDYADVIGPGFDLQISGHSHGGQIRIPGLPVLHAPEHGRKYPEGLQQAQNHLVYTTRGVGMMGPQLRTFCPPEVTLLTLRTNHGANNASTRES